MTAIASEAVIPMARNSPLISAVLPTRDTNYRGSEGAVRLSGDQTAHTCKPATSLPPMGVRDWLVV
jgi:hypothetical protein